MSTSKSNTLWSKLAASALVIVAATFPVNAAPVDAKARYVVSLAGVNVATVNIDFREDGKQYELDLGARISGIGSLVARGTAATQTKGKPLANGLQPNGFDVQTHANGKDFAVAVQYASGNASGFQVEPPIVNNIGRVAIERKHLRGVTDPLGSFILKGDGLTAKLCDRKLKVFTGMERFDIQMRYAETQTATSTRTAYQGPVVLCQLDYIPVSGHFKSSEMTKYLAESDRFLIWYAPLGDSDYFIPYRILIGTSAGDLSMVLTGLN